MAGVVFTAAAEEDIAEAVDWYEVQAPGVGARLIDELGAVVRRLVNNPLQFPIAHKDVRRALVRRFPYAVFFRVLDGSVEVIGCFHTSRDPRRWRSRT
jgi:plasmid stabilization system protein ParE